jgi:hypothetical protein
LARVFYYRDHPFFVPKSSLTPSLWNFGHLSSSTTQAIASNSVTELELPAVVAF